MNNSESGQPGMEYHALWHTTESETVIRRQMMYPEQGTVILESMYSLLSLGTELIVARGNVPVSAYETMRVPYMEGEFSLPVKYGYSLVGKIRGQEGLFHVMHPHQDKCAVRLADARPVPEGIPPARATLASNVETALTAIWDAELIPGERVLIVGFGLLGSLVARIAQQFPACLVAICDTDPARKKLAKELGFEVDEEPGMNRFDKVFHCTGKPAGLQTALNCTAFEGSVVDLTWYGVEQTTLSLGSDYHILRKRLISSQVSSIPGRMRNRWDYGRRLDAVFRLLRQPGFDRHITHMLSLQETAKLFERARFSPLEGLGYCIDYSKGIQVGEGGLGGG